MVEEAFKSVMNGKIILRLLFLLVKARGKNHLKKAGISDGIAKYNQT